MLEKMGVPNLEKPKKDIISGEVSKDGSILSWKSDATIDASSDLIEAELKKHKRMAEISKVGATQKADNVLKMADAHGPRAQRYYRSRQETVEKEKRMTRRAKDDLTSNESEKYEALFNQ